MGAPLFYPAAVPRARHKRTMHRSCAPRGCAVSATPVVTALARAYTLWPSCVSLKRTVDRPQDERKRKRAKVCGLQPRREARPHKLPTILSTLHPHNPHHHGTPRALSCCWWGQGLHQ